MQSSDPASARAGSAFLAAIRKPGFLLPAATACAVLVLWCGVLYFHLSHPSLPVIRSDGRGYYAYLRLYLIDHTTRFEKLSGAQEIAEMLYRSPRTGKVAMMYPIGTAMAQLPFFLAGHLASAVTRAPRDGLSAPYQWAIAAAGLVWLGVGLLATGRVLSARFKSTAAYFIAAALLFGTNLLHYALMEPAMSHVYAFGAMALMLWTSDLFWRAPSGLRAVGLGAAIGLLVAIRSYDVLLTPMALYPAFTRRDVGKRFAAPFLGACLLTLLPQFAVGTYYLGSPLASTYGDEAVFFWTRPKLFEVLMGVKRGWWFWTPVSALGVAGWIIGLRGAMRQFCIAALVSLAATVYLISAWMDWEMGSSFGHRGFVDCLPAIGIGIGLLWRRRWMPPAVLVLVLLNLFLTWSYWKGDMSERGVTARGYWRLLKTPLYKLSGYSPNDSTGTKGLAAEVTVAGVSLRSDQADVMTRIRNAGSALWLSDLSKGQVYLEVRGFEDTKCTGRSTFEWREPIPRDVAPGQQTTLTARIPAAMLRPFRCLRTEMLGVRWFHDIGPNPPAITPLDGSQYEPRWSKTDSTTR